MNFLKITIIFSVLFGSSIMYHWSHLNSFPTQIHAWAQCDYISISNGFQDNNFNLFLPQQNNLNKQFENADHTANLNNITSADFPIIPYFNALISSGTGKSIYKTYRILTLFISCIGLTFLFLIAYHYSSNYVVSFLSVLLLAITPIYLDYQDGYLPSTSALSFLFGGLYFLIRKKRKRHLIFAFILLTLAALIRFPLVIFLIAILSLEIWETKKIKSFLSNQKILLGIGSLIMVGGYFLYNSYLRNQYGSIFLSSMRPEFKWTAFINVITEAKTQWGLHYFTICQYLCLVFITVRGITKVFLKQSFKELESIEKVLVISSLGVLIYMFLMLSQFENHDYYSLDTFYPVLVLAGIISVNKKITSAGIEFVKISILLLFTIFSLFQANHILEDRRALDTQSGTYIIYDSFKDSEKLLNELNISTSAKILVLDAHAPNMPLLLMNRNGYSILTTSKENIIEGLEWEYDYVAIANYYLYDKVLQNYPEIKNKIELVGGNEKLIIFKKNHKEKLLCIDWLTFFNIDQETAILRDSNYQNWKNYKSLDQNNDIGFIKSEDLYSVTFETEIINGSLLHFTGIIIGPLPEDEILLITDLSVHSKTYYYKSSPISKTIVLDSKKNRFEFICRLPKIKPSSQLKLYFYNPNGKNLQYNNLEISIY